MVCPSETSPLNRSRPQPQSCHEDRQTSGHVKQEYRRQASKSEARYRLSTAKSRSRIPLFARRSQHSQNGNHQAITPKAAEAMAAEGEFFGNTTRMVPSWPGPDVSTSQIEDSPKIKSPTRSVTTAHASRVVPDKIPFSPFNGPRLHLESIESTPLVPKSSQNGHVIPLLNLTSGGHSSTVASEVPEVLEFPRLQVDGKDHLKHLENDEYSFRSILANVAHPELISDRQADSKPVPHLPCPVEQELSRQEGSSLEKQSHSQSTSEERQNHLPLPYTSDQLEPPLRNYDPDLVGEPEKEISVASSNEHEHSAQNTSQGDFTEPGRKWATFQGLNSVQQQHPQLASEISTPRENVLVRPNFSESTSEKLILKSVSSRHGKDKFLSSLGSVKSHKRGNIWGQQRRRHNFLVRNLSNRASAYEKRARLRRVRYSISVADEAFMKLVRERRMQGSEEDVALEECYRRLQEARNEYGPLEDAYNETEEQLDREEFEAKELEEKILMRDVSEPGIDLDSGSSSAGEDESAAPVIINHLLYDEFVAHTWEAVLCREKITDLGIEHENLLYSQELRRTFGMALAPEDQLTLQNFPIEEAKLLDQLREIEAEIKTSRLACIREGLLDEDGYEGEKDEEGGEIILQASSVGVIEPEQADYEKYHILMEKPENKEDEGRSKVLLTDFTEGDVGDRITCWLLHKLRLSGLEVKRLASYADSADTEKWQEEVLEFWFVDSANLESSAYVGKPTLTAIPPVPTASPNRGFDRNLGSMHEIKMIVRSSALSQKLELEMRLNLKRTNGRSVITE